MTTFNSDQTLTERLYAAIETFDDDRRQLWKETDQENVGRAIEALAGRLLRGTHDLSTSIGEEATERDWESTLELLDEIPELKNVVLEELQAAAASRWCTNTDEMAERTLELARLVVRAEPSEEVLRFLQRLSRCYIAGLGPESVILCRAVLENAVNETFRRRRIPVPATNEGQSSMGQKLDAAKMLGWLSQRGRENSWVVWKRGSKAVHDDPEVTDQVFETVQMTMEVVGELYDA